MLQILFPALLISCSASENAQSILTDLAGTKYDGEVEYASNTSKSFVICFNRPKVLPGHPLRPLRFFVFNMSNAEIVFEDSLASADVYWVTDTSLEVHFIPEVISQDEEASGYVYDVVTRSRSSFTRSGRGS
jgi:hypothetical protein